MRVAGVAALLLVSACLPHSGSASTTASFEGSYDAPATSPAASAVARPAAVQPRAVVAPLLRAAAGGDGDSWHDTAGREYRLGLVNAPEYNECYGSVATAKRRALTAGGFRARVYTRDTYRRGVAVVTTASGVNVNVYLARHGFANDRYLSQ